MAFMGEWAVIEYKRLSGRKVKVWSFQSFSEAEVFRAKRLEFYRTIRLEKKRAFTPPLPKISNAEMDLFERIIEDSQLMALITRQFID